MKSLSHLAISVALVATAMIPSLKATTLDLTEAKDFNLLTWGNTTQPNSDIEGRAAIGGNAAFTSFSIGEKIVSGTPSDGALIVGGNANLGNGSVKNGSLYVGGTYSGPGYNVNSTPGTGTFVGSPVPFNFAAAQTALSTKSLAYGATAATGTGVLQYSTLTFTGSNADLNIFNISGSDLDAAGSLALNVAAGSHVLINVSGTTVNFDYAGLSGFASELTLFNFYQANTLTLAGIGINGSILAPFANVTFNWGQMNGQLIASSFSGTGQLNNTLYNNQTPPTNVPDTTSTALFAAIGLISCRLFRRFATNRR